MKKAFIAEFDKYDEHIVESQRMGANGSIMRMRYGDDLW